MECREVSELSTCLIDNELDRAHVRQVDEHLLACRDCSEQVDSERAFHRGIKLKLSRRAPAHLSQRVLRVLNVAPATRRRRARAIWRMGPVANRPLATAAAVLLILAAWVGYQTYCVDKQCALVMAAEREHERIVAGSRDVWAVSDDPQALTSLINERLNEASLKFAGLPNDLSECQLRPRECGPLQLSGCGKGTYINLVDCICQDGEQSITLMVVDQERLPNAPEVDGLRMATYAQHSVCAWRSHKDGLLYILVGKLPYEQMGQIARLVRR